MELRANYTLIGAFTLLTLLGILFFTLWLAKVSEVELMSYDIFFEEKVSGLALNSDVLFNGIRVGSVTRLKLDKDNPGAVMARIAIAADTPVRQDSVATLENKGVTGVMLISIAGGSAHAALNIPAHGKVGSIAYQPSPLASIMATMPSILEQTHLILKQMTDMTSQENVQAVSEILQNAAKVSKALGDKSASIEASLANIEQLTANLAALSGRVNSLVQTDGKKMTTAVSSAAQQLEKMIKQLEPGLNRFMKESLPELRMFLTETKGFFHVYTRIGEKLESDPRRFLFGEPVREYQAP